MNSKKISDHKSCLHSAGVSLVEVVIATSIITLTVVTLVTIYSLVARYSLSNVRAFKATLLSEESAEVLGYLRDESWSGNISTLNINTTYRLFWNGTSWIVTENAPLLEGKYDVTFELANVYRDSNFNVVSSGGTVDNDSRKVSINIFWREGNATSTKTLETYLFNTFNN